MQTDFFKKYQTAIKEAKYYRGIYNEMVAIHKKDKIEHYKKYSDNYNSIAKKKVALCFLFNINTKGTYYELFNSERNFNLSNSYNKEYDASVFYSETLNINPGYIINAKDKKQITSLIKNLVKREYWLKYLKNESRCKMGYEEWFAWIILAENHKTFFNILKNSNYSYHEIRVPELFKETFIVLYENKNSYYQ